MIDFNETFSSTNDRPMAIAFTLSAKKLSWNAMENSQMNGFNAASKLINAGISFTCVNFFF